MDHGMSITTILMGVVLVCIAIIISGPTANILRGMGVPINP